MKPTQSMTVTGFFGQCKIACFDLGARSVMLADRTTTNSYHTIFVTNLGGKVIFGAWEDDAVREVVFAMVEKLLDDRKKTSTDVNYSLFHPESLYNLLSKTDPCFLRDFTCDLPNLCPAGPLTLVIESTSKH